MGKDIGKRFIITLSGKDEKITLPNGQEIPIREIETAMLTNLFDLAASSEKSFKSANECLDCIGQVESLGEDETELTLAQIDMDYLKSGWDKASENMGRPMIWNKCRALIAQFANPKEKTE